MAGRHQPVTGPGRERTGRSENADLKRRTGSRQACRKTRDSGISLYSAPTGPSPARVRIAPFPSPRRTDGRRGGQTVFSKGRSRRVAAYYKKKIYNKQN